MPQIISGVLPWTLKLPAYQLGCQHHCHIGNQGWYRMLRVDFTPASSARNALVLAAYSNQNEVLLKMKQAEILPVIVTQLISAYNRYAIYSTARIICLYRIQTASVPGARETALS